LLCAGYSIPLVGLRRSLARIWAILRSGNNGADYARLAAVGEQMAQHEDARFALICWRLVGISYRLCGHAGVGPWSRYAFEMKRRIDQSVVSVERHKKRYLAELAKGRAPTVAARMAGLARSTVYKWRREDVEFAAAWVDCVEQGLDLLEDRAYQRAMKNSDQLLMFQLRARRPEVYGRSGDSRPQPSNFILNLTLQERLKRLERLGLPVPVFETDYEDVDAPPAGHP
jgi:hypothetical protein